MLQIYKASAGSGKTFTLTREYIKYLIAVKHSDGRYRLRRHPASDHSRILAITFTNKATNEMTRRIIKELALLGGMATPDELLAAGLTPDQADESTLLSPYAGEFLDPVTGLDCTVDELRATCRTALTNLLYDYTYFNVSTIDSFFQSVLRMFTREVELPDNYNVELNNRFAISLGVDEMYNTLGYHTIPDTPEDVERRWVTEWLYQFMQANMAEGGSFNMFSRSSRLYGELVDELAGITDEQFKRRLDTLRPYFADKSRLVRFAAGLNKALADARSRVTEAARHALTLMPAEAFGANFLNAMTKLAAGKDLDSDKSVVNVAGNPAAASTAAKIKKYGIDADTLRQCADAAAEYVAMAGMRAELRPLLKRVYIFGLLSTIITHIDAYCRENSLILLSETNNILKGLINDDETPFIYEKLGYYLDHFLIDEFQDTSPMQWDNLRPLVMESLGRGNDNLVIGDEKQCIYRFRNSDPRLLGEQVGTDAVARFRTADVIDVKGMDISDNSNWRSAVEIVTFNNSLFMALARIVDDTIGPRRPGVLSATETYANIIQQIDSSRRDRHGYVNIVIQHPGSGDEEPTPLDYMTSQIARQLNAGYRPGDIAVLVRGHREAEEVNTHLLTEMARPDSPLPRFDIMSEDAMELSTCQSVRLIISILRIVSLPEFLESDPKATADATGTTPPPSAATQRSDSYRRARLINRFQFYMHYTHPDGTPYTAAEALDAALVDNRTPQDDSRDEDSRAIRSLLDMDLLNLPSVTERIIHTFVPAGLKERDNLFLTTFQDTVLEYTEWGGHDIRRFLEWWDKTGSRRTVTSPAGGNALTVMTIHKAKGLEFACVHIPFADGEMFKDNRTVSWIDLNRDAFAQYGVDPDDVPPAMPLKISGSMTGSAIYGTGCADVIAQSMVDELNVNYVALTRPTAELCVFAPYRKEGFSDYLTRALTMLTDGFIDSLSLDPDAAEWVRPLAANFDGTTFTLGEPTRPRRVKAEPVKPSGDHNILMRSYTTAAAVGGQPGLRARIETDDIYTPDDQRLTGILLHAIMGIVTRRDRLQAAVERVAYRYRLEQHRADALRRRLEQALANPRAARWFDGFERVITERPMTTDGDTRRPDRIVWLPDGTVEVIDYKFVDTLPDSLDPKANKTHAKYLRQVRRYVSRVAASTGRPATGYIWYIAPDADLIAGSQTLFPNIC